MTVTQKWYGVKNANSIQGKAAILKRTLLATSERMLT